MRSALGEVADNLLGLAVERRVLKFARKPIFPDREAVISRGDANFVDCLQGQLDQVGQSVADLRTQIPVL